MMPRTAAVSVIGVFGFCICFEFRASGFEFPGQARIQKMKLIDPSLSMLVSRVYSASAISLAASTTSSIPPLM
jgi:hypothetical protein